jgi:hypothetical protein
MTQGVRVEPYERDREAHTSGIAVVGMKESCCGAGSVCGGQVEKIGGARWSSKRTVVPERRRNPLCDEQVQVRSGGGVGR